MTRIVAVCAAVFVALALGGCDALMLVRGFPEPKIVAQRALPIQLSYREGKGGLVIISGRVNDKVEVDFVLDTGAPVTVLIDGERTAALAFDTSNARRLGPADDPAAPIGVIRSGFTLAFGDVKLTELTAVVLPESSLACPERFRTTGFAGVIGADLFRRFVVEVDPRSKRIRLHEPGAWKAPPDAIEVPLAFDHGHPFVETKVTLPDGRFVTLPMHLDTGMTSALALVADRDSALAMPEGGEVTRACFVSGWQEVRSGPAVSVNLGSATFSGVATSYSTGAGRPAVQQRGAVGSGMLSQRPYVVNYPGKRLVLI